MIPLPPKKRKPFTQEADVIVAYADAFLHCDDSKKVQYYAKVTWPS